MFIHCSFRRTIGAIITAAILAACSGGGGSNPQIPITSGTQAQAPSSVLTAGQHHVRYRVIDVGTFGGPDTYLPFSSFNSFPTISRDGTVVGASATSVAINATSNGFVCGGIDGVVPNIFHAFKAREDEVTDLGALPTASQHCSIADSINDNGDVAGISEIADAIDPIFQNEQLRAVLFTDGRVINLGTLDGGVESLAFGINNRDQIVGTAVNTTPDPFSLIYFGLGGFTNGTQARAVLYERRFGSNVSIRDLGTLGGPDAQGAFVNERGQVAGNSYTNYTPNATTHMPPLEPFLWTDGKMRDVGNLGGDYGFPNALNDRGEVTGDTSVAADPAACFTGTPNCHVFLWNGARVLDLTTASPVGKPISAAAINDAGDVVGFAAFPRAPMDAFLWRNGALTDLGHLNDCGSFSAAINSRDQVVGGTFTCAAGVTPKAFLWEHGTMFDLNALIPPNSNLQLLEADAINDKGVIVGQGVPQGVSSSDFTRMGRVFLLIPVGKEDSLAAASGVATIAEHKLSASEEDTMRALALHMRLAPHRAWRRR